MLLSLALIAAVWAGVFFIAWRFPESADKWWLWWVHLAVMLSRRRALLFFLVALLPLLLRGVLLPLWPIPDPYVQDEFSYLLQADTFAHGRLTNPTPAVGEFFESAQILVRPSYTSKYPPGHALAMALGQRLMGHPWFGVWLSCSVLAAALLWALEGWFATSWAMFGTLLALPLCSFAYWMNSYMGGSVAAIGGALVVGAYGRLTRRKQDGAAWVLGAGCVLLVFTRPFEGLLIAIPTLVMCLLARVSLSAWARVACVGLIGAAALGYYNHRVTGDASKLPYFEYNAQYISTPQFSVLPLGPPKQFRYQYMKLVDEVWERQQWENSRRPRFLVDRTLQWVGAAAMYAGGTGSFLPLIAVRASAVDQGAVFNLDNVIHIFLMGAMVLVPVAIFARPLAKTGRTRFAFVLVGASVAGSFLSAPFYQHYAAPAVAPLLVLVTGAYRHLRHAQSSGPMFAALIPLVAIGMSILNGVPALLHDPAVLRVAARARLEDTVKEHSGKHLIIVRYSGIQRPIEEWVYNGADLDGSQVIWAHDQGPIENRRLTSYFHDRQVWLFQPNIDAEWIGPYRD
jgi:hypothetical protein